MRSILVPTDFSPCAENALLLAVELAGKLSYQLELVHAYQGSVAALPGSSTIRTAVAQEEKVRAEGKLYTACLRAKHAGGFSCRTHSVDGEPVTAIISKQKEIRSDMIVMGTVGDSSIANALFGSTASRVMEKASCPVIAVPADFPFSTPIRRVTFASDFHVSDVSVILELAQLCDGLGAQLNVLHVFSGSLTTPAEEVSRMKRLMDDVAARIQMHNLSFQVMHADDVRESLGDYISRQNTDVLVTSAHARDLFDRLFGRSLTRFLAMHSPVPVMTFHYQPKASLKIF